MGEVATNPHKKPTSRFQPLAIRVATATSGRRDSELRRREQLKPSRTASRSRSHSVPAGLTPSKILIP